MSDATFSRVVTFRLLAAALALSLSVPVFADEDDERPALPREKGSEKATTEQSPATIDVVAPPTLDTVRAQVIAWVAAKNPPSQVAEEVARLWIFDQTPTAEELFDAALQSFQLVDPETRAFVDACKLVEAPLSPPESSVIARGADSPLYFNALKLFYGRYLVQRKMYEEGLETLADLKPIEAIDPGALLFSRAVCQHQLQQKEEGLATLKQLLATEGVPVRYTTLATLMQYDLEQLDDKSLDGVSRKMSDVERRLTLGRTGPRVQKKEAEIIASLDEIIKKIEEQQGGGGGQGSDGQNNSNQSGSPANDSRVKGNTAPGNVDSKKFAKEGAWGSLPAKDRPKATQLIGRLFPSHYDRAIQEFSRKQAAREETGSGKKK